MNLEELKQRLEEVTKKHEELLKQRDATVEEAIRLQGEHRLLTELISKLDQEVDNG